MLPGGWWLAAAAAAASRRGRPCCHCAAALCLPRAADRQLGSHSRPLQPACRLMVVGPFSYLTANAFLFTAAWHGGRPPASKLKIVGAVLFVAFFLYCDMKSTYTYPVLASGSIVVTGASSGVCVRARALRPREFTSSDEPVTYGSPQDVPTDDCIFGGRRHRTLGGEGAGSRLRLRRLRGGPQDERYGFHHS
jgi:hypothetical protein